MKAPKDSQSELDPEIQMARVRLPFLYSFTPLTNFFPFMQTYDARSKELGVAKAPRALFNAVTVAVDEMYVTSHTYILSLLSNDLTQEILML
jgi:hypothetical protein